MTTALSPQALLILAVAVVGVLHTAVPDHWAPISLLARQHRWSRQKTARTAFIAGLGHVISTLAIALVVWFAGAALAARFGHLLSWLSSAALVVFGMWIAIGSWRELRAERKDASAHREAAVRDVSSRTALLLILGSSPMVEGIPAFFAAGRYGAGLLAIMAAVFALSTVATYVGLCLAGASGMQRIKLGRLEQYGEIISGAFIALLGLIFAFFPAL